MVSMMGTSWRVGLLLIFVVCTFTGVADGRGVATGGDVIAKLEDSGGGDGALGGEDGMVADGAGDAKSSQRSDHSEAKRVGGVNLVARNVLNVKVMAETTGTGSNDTKVDSTNSSTLVGSPPVSPPPGKPKNNTAEHSPPAIVTHAPAPRAQDASIGDEAKSPPAHGGTCTRGPVIARLAASGGGDGEDGDHDYTLTVENGGGKSQLEVTIKTSNRLKADPTGLVLKNGKMVLKKGEMKPVTISVIDKEAANLGARINISWGEGDCYVEFPAEHMGDTLAHPSYLSLLSAQGTFALVLGGTLVFVLILGVVGVWGCVSWRAHARRHGDAEAKYQELEMTLPAEVSKQDEGMSPSADGWDEVWEDDDWQDTEAVRSSSTSLTLSANGLNSRRANKDGWDSSWDD
ncbi:hypothetical protein M758_2G104900 [Ceratodon purpureus]|nr:hypothetical protein M758_2G104900 [Ceratodon purpureus]